MTTRYLAILFSILLACSSCAPKVIKSTPWRLKVKTPPKQIPERDKIPPTQKPYEIMGKTYYPIPSAYGYSETGIASWYGKKFHGRKTSNGETYDMYGPTAAHKTLPMNTNLLVENLENSKKTFVRINDRGPFVKGRIIDLSLTGAREIGMKDKGTAKVRITALGEAVSSVRGGKKIERFRPYQDFNKGEFFVQVGSFTEKKNADNLKKILLCQGKKAVTQVFELGKETYYRVQVRAGTNLTEAEKAEKELGERFPGSFVIAR